MGIISGTKLPIHSNIFYQKRCYEEFFNNRKLSKMAEFSTVKMHNCLRQLFASVSMKVKTTCDSTVAYIYFSSREVAKLEKVYSSPFFFFS